MGLSQRVRRGCLRFLMAGFRPFDPRVDPNATSLRRAAAKGQQVDLDAVTADIEQRDHIDSTRTDGPLIRPDGAIDLDTSDMSIDEVVDAMVDAVRSMLAPGATD